MNRTKKTVFEVVIILILSGSIGLVYNAFSPKPLPLVRQKQEIASVSDSIIKAMMQNDSAKHVAPVLEAKSDSLVDSVPNPIKQAPSDLVRESIASVKKNFSMSKKNPTTLTYEQVKKYRFDPKFFFIDARPPELFNKGRIGNAVNIYPLQDDHDNYMKSLVKLPTDKIIVVYCDGGECELSHDVINDLKSFGFSKVLLYAGGWEEWSHKMKS
jgi:rhodanese-related sulfurtransferase